MKRLTYAAKKDFGKFFDSLAIGESFVYSGSFMFRCVDTLAKEHGYVVKYNDPGTELYGKLGTRSATLVSKKSK